MRKVRGSLASMIFQEPMTALNPVFTIGNQMVEIIRVHQKVSKADAKKQAIEMLRTVNIESPEQAHRPIPSRTIRRECDSGS